MRWFSASAYASALVLLAAVAAQLLSWWGLRAWTLLAWTILLFFALFGLFRHPMRWPAWGLFVGFWGEVGVLWLIVIQIFNVADVLHQPAYGEWAAWPLAVIGIWLLVVTLLGFGNDVYPALVDGLGAVAGIGFLAISITVWTGLANATRPGAAVTAGLYVLYAFGLGYVLWASAPPAQTLEAVPAH